MNTHRQNGFTLIEALVALTILTVGLVPAFLQARNALSLAGSVRNSLVAAHLAQEGAELTRALRDADWFASRPFGKSLATCAAGCRLQWNSSSILPLVGNPPLRVDPDTGLYQYNRGDDTRFSRQVTVTLVSADELQVEVLVSWDESSGPKEFSVEHHLYNWLQ
jgi:prepilin-type N-terminal cleavage/methylation domain-containing protein